ncbi:MAG: rRNA pseudouridine synthase [Actinobacteria bacterium]|nr:rRNA pseudouridine synthase [Actinomycetota bacterium]
MSDAERVQKVLAAAGLGSRRQSEALIAAGRVTVNGRTARLGDRADPAVDVLTVDGVRVQTDPTLVHYLLNKPLGVITTMHDPQGRPTVADYITMPPRVFPVGRLDADTEGLLVLTNDGPLAQRLTHPRHHVPKTYVAKLRGAVRRQAVRALTDGIELDDGIAVATAVRTLATARDETLLQVVVTEGRNRMVRRMLGAVGLTLERLARVQLGPLALGDMGQGRVRPLTSREVHELYEAVKLGDPDTDAPAVPVGDEDDTQ